MRNNKCRFDFNAFPSCLPREVLAQALAANGFEILESSPDGSRVTVSVPEGTEADENSIKTLLRSVEFNFCQGEE